MAIAQQKGARGTNGSAGSIGDAVGLASAVKMSTASVYKGTVALLAQALRAEGQRRVYSLRPETLGVVDDWLRQRLMLWQHRMGALHTEVARGRRQRRSEQ